MFKSQKLNERGIVALVSVSIIAVAVTIVSIGMLNLTTRTQVQVEIVDSGSQAFYSAEAGIEQARKAVTLYQANPATVNLTENDCALATGAGLTGVQNPSGDGYIDDNPSDTTPGLTIACQKIDITPSDLRKDIDEGGSWVSPNIKLLTPAGVPLGVRSLTIEWTKHPLDATIDMVPSANTTDWLPYDQWRSLNRLPALKVEVVSVPSGTISSANTRYSSFLISPTAVASTQTVGAGAPAPGAPANGGCNGATDTCSVTFNLSPILAVSDDAKIRITPVYRGTSVKVTAVGDLGGAPFAGIADFSRAQAVIDSTGRSNSNYRRLIARVNIFGATNEFPFPANVIESADSICKLLQTAPGATGTTNACP